MKITWFDVEVMTNFMEQSSSSETNSHSAGQEIVIFYRIKRFITSFRRTHHWSLSWARCIQFTLSYPIPI